jgi:signal transduction histidine kinase
MIATVTMAFLLVLVVYLSVKKQQQALLLLDLKQTLKQEILVREVAQKELVRQEQLAFMALQESEARFRQSVQRLNNLRQIDKAILEAQKTEAIAIAAIDSLLPLVPCLEITIIIFDSSTQSAKVLSKQQGKDKNSSLQQFQSIDLGLWLDSLEKEQQNESYSIASISRLFYLPNLLKDIQPQGSDRFILFPLITNKSLLGVLWLWLGTQEKLTSEQLNIAREISDRSAIALNQVHLYEQIQRYSAKLEEKVALRTSQLLDVNQELEAFAYSVSHDLRAPLRALQGFASAILEDYGDGFDSLGKEYAQRLVNAAEYMDRLIQDLLSYSRIARAQLNLSEVSLSLIVAQALIQLEEDLRITEAKVIVEEPLPVMLGNQTVLLQIVNNLLSNALKFVSPNVYPKIRIWGEQRENQVRLWIEDNGIGIKEEHRERIFRVFERLHGSETYPGTGIGLAIVRKGMERLGGRVGVESIPNLGSRFWIEGQDAEKEKSEN